MYTIYLKYKNRDDLLFKLYSIDGRIWSTDSKEELENKLEELSQCVGKELIFPVYNIIWNDQIYVEGEGECNKVVISETQPPMVENDRWYKIKRVIREVS